MAEKTEKKVERASNLCCYSQRVCNLEKLKGFHFCHKHILEDKASPFKPCSFIAKSNGKRCSNPAPKMPDKEKSYCIIHTRKAELRRAVEERKKRKKRNSVDELWSDMEEYREHSKRKRTMSSTSHKSKDGSHKGDFHSSEEEEMNMDPPSGSEELSKVDSAWHGDADSDAESVNSEDEDPLKHAGVWTTEEAVRMCRDKMVRLRSLYIDQFKRLQHVLKEKRRKYLHAIQVEEENEFGEFTVPVSQLLGKRRRKVHGEEALLHKQAKEKRTNTGGRHQNLPHLRCTYINNGNRCTDRILPLTKYCLHHVNHDPNQVLFERCTFRNGDNQQCETLVPRAYAQTTCLLHMQLPTQALRTDVKTDLEEAKESDRDRKTKELEQKVKTELSITLPGDGKAGSSMGLSEQGTSGETSSALLPDQKLLIPLGPPPPIIGSKLAVLVPPSEAQAQKEKEAVQEPEQVKTSTTEAPQQMTDVKVKKEAARIVEEGMSTTNSPTGSLSGIDISPSLAAASIIAVCSPQSSAGEGSKCSASVSVYPATTAFTQAGGSLSSTAAATTTTIAIPVRNSSTNTTSVTETQGDSSVAPLITNKETVPIVTTSTVITNPGSLLMESKQSAAMVVSVAGTADNSKSSTSTTALTTHSDSTDKCTSTAASTVMHSATNTTVNAGMSSPAGSGGSTVVDPSPRNTASIVISTLEKQPVGSASAMVVTCAMTQPSATSTSISTIAEQNLNSTPAASASDILTGSTPTSVETEQRGKETLSSVARTLRTVSLFSTKPLSGDAQEIKKPDLLKSANKDSKSDAEMSDAKKQTKVQGRKPTSHIPSSAVAQSCPTECSGRESDVEEKAECLENESETVYKQLNSPQKATSIAP